MFERHELTNQACSFLNSSLSGKSLGREGVAPDKQCKKEKAEKYMNPLNRSDKGEWTGKRTVMTMLLGPAPRG